MCLDFNEYCTIETNSANSSQRLTQIRSGWKQCRPMLGCNLFIYTACSRYQYVMFSNFQNGLNCLSIINGKCRIFLLVLYSHIWISMSIEWSWRPMIIKQNFRLLICDILNCLRSLPQHSTRISLNVLLLT